MPQNKALTRIHVYQLQVGMFIGQLDIPWESSPFLLQGFEIGSRADIKALQNVCEYVYIDASRQKSDRGNIKSASNAELLTTFNQAADVYEETSSLVKSIMDDIRFGNNLNVQAAKDAVARCVDQVLEDSDAMLLLTQLKNKDEYTSQHSLNVCILSIIFARSLKMERAQLNKVGLCGLLHDMGKMKVPNEILNKPGHLTSNESEIMKAHTTEGRDILMSARDLTPAAVDVAYSHHERLDGTGYPRRLGASGISKLTRLISIVDAYDAITSDRVYKKGRLHLEAINILTECRDTHFDGSLVLKFVDCIGIYPVGNPVKMSNGDVGVVIRSNPGNKIRPQVLLLCDKAGEPIERTLLDMSDPACVDANGKPYRIVMVMRKDQCRMDLYEFYQQGGLQEALAGQTVGS